MDLRPRFFFPTLLTSVITAALLLLLLLYPRMVRHPHAKLYDVVRGWPLDFHWEHFDSTDQHTGSRFFLEPLLLNCVILAVIVILVAVLVEFIMRRR